MINISTSLWGANFEITTESNTKKVVDKLKKEPKAVKDKSIDKLIKSSKVDLTTKLDLISKEVNKILGHYKEQTVVIKDLETLRTYIDCAIQNGVIAIDTETNNSLDPITCKLMGACIYTKGQKNAYIPINHTDLNGNKLSWQLTEDDIYNQFSRLGDTKIIFHNAKFDYEVLKCTCGVDLSIYWDTYIGARVLNENEPANLKEQYILKIDSSQEKYSIEHLFKDIPYNVVSPDLFALYAATDSYMTYELYEYQLNQFSLADNKDIYTLFRDIEIPIIKVVAGMELRGIEIDLDYAKKLSEAYHNKLAIIEKQIEEELNRLNPIIDKWRQTPEANYHPINQTTGKPQKSANEKLANPIELGSSTQMAILLYDILKVGIIDKEKPRGTGEEIISKLVNKVPLCKLLLDKRGVDILINTFIDNIPQLIKEKTGRLHASFNTYGADTGRFSSSDPNLQNIPSHSKEIRLMFKAKDGYSIVGSDYSAQEPRSLASFSGDKAMLQAYEEDKDLYAIIGSKCFNNNYEDNLEFNPITHEQQPDGKARRGKAKVIQLAISYGMGPSTLAEKINVSIDEAKRIIEDFYKGFPEVKKFTEESQEMLRTYGYVTDMWGRRRRIPKAQLKKFEVSLSSMKNRFNPLLHTKGKILTDNELKLLSDIENKLNQSTSYKDINAIISNANSNGVTVVDNRSAISRATRQCLNARIQGTAASMTKKAMIEVDKDEILNRLGFKLLVTVHDEIFGECPKENSEQAAKRLAEIMVNVAKEKCSCKFKCDGYCVSRWYEDEVSAEVKKEYNDFLKNLDAQKAFDKIKEIWSMVSNEYLYQMCTGVYECNLHNDI